MAACSTAMLLAGCASPPRPVVRGIVTLGGGARTIALAPPPPGSVAVLPAAGPGLAEALARAGLTLRSRPVEARYLLVLTAARAPAGVGALVPGLGDRTDRSDVWLAKPVRGLGLGAGGVSRVGAVLKDAASGAELWRAEISARRRAPDEAALAMQLLKELPRDAGSAGGGPH